MKMCASLFLIKTYDASDCVITGKLLRTEKRLPNGLYPFTIEPCLGPTKLGGCTPNKSVRFSDKVEVISTEEVNKRLISRVSTIDKHVCLRVPDEEVPKDACIADEAVVTHYEDETFVAGCLARSYPREGVSEVERWHWKLGHVNVSKLKKMNLGINVGKKGIRCEPCLHGKIQMGCANEEEKRH